VSWHLFLVRPLRFLVRLLSFLIRLLSYSRRWQDRFYRWKFQHKSAGSILQALSCRFCRLKLSNPSKLMISKKWKSRIVLLVTKCLGAFFQMVWRRKPARFALPKARPTLFEKISRGGVELTKFKQIMKARNTQTSKLQPKNQQDRACRIELADLGLNFHRAKSVLPPASE